MSMSFTFKDIKKLSKDTIRGNIFSELCVLTTVIFFFLLCMLIEEVFIFFTHSQNYWSLLNDSAEKVINSLSSIAMPALITFFSALVYFIVLSPLILGVKYRRVLLAQNKPAGVLIVFTFFKSIKTWFKAFMYTAVLFTVKLFWSVLFLIPSFALFSMSLFSLSATNEVYINIANYFSVPVSLSIFLFPCVFVFSSILLCIFLKRYYFVPYILADDITTPIFKAFLKSSELSKHKKSDIFLFELSFFHVKLLNLFIFPIVYTIPYISLSRIFLFYKLSGIEHKSCTLNNEYKKTAVFKKQLDL